MGVRTGIYRVAAALVAATLAACSDVRDGPATAKGETGVRYVICSRGDTNCFVDARFKHFETCERYNRDSSMLCDRTDPGRMVCKADSSPLAVGYCTK